MTPGEANNQLALAKFTPDMAGEDPQNLPPESISSSKSSNENKKQSKSLSILQKIVQSRDFEIKRIKLMQSTLETIRTSLTFQSQFLINYLNNSLLELPQLKEKTAEEGLTPQEK